MRHYALIGRTLTHSYSKSLFDSQGFVGADYRLQPMASIDGLRQWVERKRVAGFNVTNPYKRTILPMLDTLSPEAEAIGAVNCVVVEGGRMTGYNTDAPAFLQTLTDLLNTCKSIPNASFILGTGGAAHAVAYALDQLGIPHRFVSRHPDRHPDAIGYDQLPEFDSPNPTLIINATPVGTWPDVDRSPLPPFTAHRPLASLIVYDLVYNPSPTLLLRQAAECGARTMGGLAMLRRQAELSWHLWGLVSEP